MLNRDDSDVIFNNLPLYVEEHCLKWASFEELIVYRHKSLGRIRPENYINPDAGKI